MRWNSCQARNLETIVHVRVQVGHLHHQLTTRHDWLRGTLRDLVADVPSVLVASE